MNPLYLIILPLLIAFFLPIWEKLVKKTSAFVVLAVEVIGLFGIYTFYKSVASKLPLKIILAGYRPPIGINLYISKFSLLVVGIVYLMAFVVTLYQVLYRKDVHPKFFVVYLLLLAGLSGLTLTADIFNMFVFFEITAIASYILVSLGDHKDSFEAGLKYLIIGSIGSVFLLLGIGFLYAFTGTLNIADLGKKLVVSHKFVDLGVLFIMLGLGVKAEIFPLNMWVPDAYQTSHFEIAAFLSSVVPKIALLLMLRILWVIYTPALLLKIFMVLGVLGVVVGEFAAYRQKDVFRMLAYSSIAQMGFIFLILSVGKTKGVLTAALFYALIHLISKFFLFFIAGIWKESYGVREVEEFSGLFQASPLLSFIFGIFVLTLIGIPPTVGFFAKYYALVPMLKLGGIYYGLLLIVALSISVEAAYFLRLLQNIYFKKNEKLIEKQEERKAIFIPASVSAVFSLVIVCMSAYPERVLLYVGKMANIFSNIDLYIKTILS